MIEATELPYDDDDIGRFDPPRTNLQFRSTIAATARTLLAHAGLLVGTAIVIRMLVMAIAGLLLGVWPGPAAQFAFLTIFPLSGLLTIAIGATRTARRTASFPSAFAVAGVLFLGVILLGFLGGWVGGGLGISAASGVALIAFAVWIVAIPAAASEHLGIHAALERSRLLTDDDRGVIANALLVAFLIPLAGLVVGLATGGELWWASIGFGALCDGFVAALSITSWRALRRLREGRDVEVVADVFD